MDIVYIEHGSCTMHVPGFPRWQVNNSSSIDGLAIGSGCFLGMKTFLLGASCADCMDDAVVKAWTDEVVVRRLRVQRQAKGRAPLHVSVIWNCIYDMHVCLNYACVNRLCKFTCDTDLKSRRQI